MKLKIAHICDIFGMYFNIPDYQRGYRWEKKQVHDLLNDLLEFSLNEGSFYCLQPLVVVKNDNITVDKEFGTPVFDVVDGQQRLTTLFLILNYTGLLESNDIESYHMRYERAIEKEDKQKYTSGELQYSKLKNLVSNQIANNPDYFYMTQAIKDIEIWFKEKKDKYPKIKSKIFNVLCPDDYKKADKPFYDLDRDENEALHDVRFIWYDATIGENTHMESIEIFKRLNYGKTSLSAAELIKALLFQCDLYDPAKKPEMKQVAFRMSTEWDAIEKKLQDKFMWSMIQPDNYDKPSHIDIVLSYVARHLIEKKGVVVKTLKRDKDYDYLVFNKYLENKTDSGEQEINYLWSCIQDVFAVLNSWYEDTDLYHLVGLHFMLNGSQNIVSSIVELKSMYETKDRAGFIDWLKHEKIGTRISLKGKKLKNSDEELTLDNIYYGDYSSEIVNILLTINVTLCMRHKQDQQRFPFYFCKKKKYIHSLEHIHPQHLHNEDIDFMTLCRWFMDKKEGLQLVDSSDKKKMDEAQQAVDKLTKYLELTDKEMEQIDKDAKLSFKQKEQFYETNRAKFLVDLNAIDRFFDELAKISDKDLHSITNMALVDRDTNAALGNGLLNTKRKKLQELSHKFEASKGKQGAITFAGTWKIFNKEYCTNSNDPKVLATSSNLNYWTKLDRDNYIKEIKEIYNEYVR